MSQARRARTNAQPQYPQQHASSYPPPQASGYPPPHAQYAQQPSGYPQQPSGYPQHPQHPQAGYGQQPHYPQQGYPQPYAQQQHYPQQQQQYPYAPAPYAQNPYAPQHYSQAPMPQYPQHPQQPYQGGAYPKDAPTMEREVASESGVHPADFDGRTIVRPSFGKKATNGAPVEAAPVAQIAAPAVAAPAHNDTVIAVSPFADPFAAARLQHKSDPPGVHHDPNVVSSLAETRVQNVDPVMLASTHPSPQPQVVGSLAPHASAYPPNHGAMAFAPTTAMPQMPAQMPPAAGAPAARPQTSSVPSPRPGSLAPAKPSTSASTAPKAAGGSAIPGMGLRFGVHGAGNVNVDLSKMNKYAGRFGAGMVPVMGFGAVVFAALFDIVFAKVLPLLPFHMPILNRIWYITTALAFAAAGYGAALMTKAGKGFVFTTAVVVAILYGALDIVIVKVLEGGDLHDALFIAIQGVVIGCVCGVGMAIKGFSNRPA